ncbi:MAG: hypothetical protein WBD99_03210 [Thermodesulfobacteriota bacterium]
MRELLIVFVFAFSFIGGLRLDLSFSNQLAFADHHEAQSDESAEPDSDQSDENGDDSDAEMPGGEMPDAAGGDEEPSDSGN